MATEILSNLDNSPVAPSITSRRKASSSRFSASPSVPAGGRPLRHRTPGAVVISCQEVIASRASAGAPCGCASARRQTPPSRQTFRRWQCSPRSPGVGTSHRVRLFLSPQTCSPSAAFHASPGLAGSSCRTNITRRPSPRYFEIRSIFEAFRRSFGVQRIPAPVLVFDPQQFLVEPPRAIRELESDPDHPV